MPVVPEEGRISIDSINAIACLSAAVTGADLENTRVAIA